VTKTSAMDLSTGVMGKSKEKLEGFMESSIGGILLIDEAYMLLDNAGGHEVLNRLVEAMEEVKYKNKLMVWMSGYGPETPQKNLYELFRFNSGLSERFPKMMRFPSWSAENCLKLLEDTLKKKFTLAFPDKNSEDGDSSNEFYHAMNDCMRRVHEHPSFGNARTMINLADVVYEKFCVRNSDNPVKSFLVASKDIKDAFNDWLTSRDDAIAQSGASCLSTTFAQQMNTRIEQSLEVLTNRVEERIERRIEKPVEIKHAHVESCDKNLAVQQIQKQRETVAKATREIQRQYLRMMVATMKFGRCVMDFEVRLRNIFIYEIFSIPYFILYCIHIYF